ncbi:tetratricopeptide repeat protein [Haliangium ochraceum]|uniref:tetratricopeptide repeat protein n=1 Tax=Haliangium ochraceum TaxID=80816 RepID=UPI000BB4C411|nr:tetratricopeptide repeat protein [Haliangium ochraceum]
MATRETGSVTFAFVKLRHLARSFEAVAAAEPPDDEGGRRVLRVADSLGPLALPICLRELGASSDARAQWAATLLVRLGQQPELARRLASELRALAVQAPESSAGQRAGRLLDALGGDEDSDQVDEEAPAAESLSSFEALLAADDLSDATLAAGVGPHSRADVARAAERLMRDFDGEVVVAFVDTLAENQPLEAGRLIDELLLRDDLDLTCRHALQRVGAPLERSAPPLSAELSAAAEAAVRIGHHGSGRSVVVISCPEPSAGKRRRKRRMLCLGVTAEGVVGEGLYAAALSATRIERELLTPLRRRGYRFSKSSLASATALVTEAARSSVMLGRTLPRAFYLGRDLVGIYDEHVTGLRSADPHGPLLEHGLERLARGEAERARPVFERYIKRRPESGEGRAALARCLVQLGALEEARGELLRAIALDADNPLHHWNLAAIAHRQERSGGCYLALRDYLDMIGDGAFDAGRGPCDERRRTAERFVAEYERVAAIEYSSTRPAAVARAEDLLLKARLRSEIAPDAAIALLEQAVSMVPEYAQAWFDLGTLLLRGERLEEAASALRRARRLRPGDARVRRALLRAERALAQHVDESADGAERGVERRRREPL